MNTGSVIIPITLGSLIFVVGCVKRKIISTHKQRYKTIFRHSVFMFKNAHTETEKIQKKPCTEVKRKKKKN